MSHVVIVYHSGYGHTQKQAQAVLKGVDSVADVNSQRLAINQEGEISEKDWATLNNARAIVFGSPTYMGMASWQFKKFADASSKVWFQQGWKDKIAAGFTNSGTINGDKFSTLTYMFTLAMQHSMVWIGTGLMPSNKKDAQRNDLNYLGAFSGAIAQSPSDASPEEGPLPGDLATAEKFGERVAQAALRWAD